MTKTVLDTDVLIVGAGPVGLFLANECARRGLRWRLIEERASQSIHSKALAIFPRTLEIFDMAGIAAPFLDKANRVTSVVVTAHQRSLAHLRFEPAQTPYPFIAMVPQNVTEELLVQELRGKGGQVEYGTAFVSAEQHDGSVTVTVDRKGETATLQASIVVGCDGARSKVRKTINLPLEGGEYKDEFMLADIETNEYRPSSEMQLCPSEFGPVAIFPMSATRRRIVATIRQPEGDAPGLDLVQRILRERAPAGIEARALHWSSYFRIHHRHAPQLRAGRIFIAGDAAHIHSPFGGQGMNTGLQDAWNLAWKLDLFLQSRGGEGLLDSYTAERIPVIRNVIETTDFLTRTLGTSNKVTQFLRDAVIPAASHLQAVQDAFVNRLSGLGIAYPGSPVNDGAGVRYFDDSLRAGGIAGRFLLLIPEGADASLAGAASQLCRDFNDIAELRISRVDGVKLVRPDGYLAYESHNGATHDALASVRALLKQLIH